MKHIKAIFELEKSEYLFSELDHAAKQVAMDRFLENELEDLGEDWADNSIEEMEGELIEMGWYKTEIEYSGFYNQGDGASFTGKLGEDLEAKRKFFIDVLGMSIPEVMLPALDAEITRNSSRYVHYNSVEITVFKDEDWFIDRENDGESTDEIVLADFLEFAPALDVNQYINKAEQLGSEWLVLKCKEIYRTLEKEYEGILSYYRSEENMQDFFDTNEYKFDQQGNCI
jgi:hypothetical protein